MVLIWTEFEITSIFKQLRQHPLSYYCAVAFSLSQYSLDLLFRFYQRNNKGHLVNAPYVDNSYKWGGGGFLSTVGDLVRFGNILLYAKQSGDDKNDNTGLISYNNENDGVNKKMLEYDRLLTALIYGLIECFRSKVSHLTCTITNICNRTGQIGRLSRQ